MSDQKKRGGNMKTSQLIISIIYILTLSYFCTIASGCMSNVENKDQRRLHGQFLMDRHGKIYVPNNFEGKKYYINEFVEDEIIYFEDEY